MSVHRFKAYICYGETDAGGVVYHANYLRLMEYARMDMLKSMHLLSSELSKKGLLFVVYKLDIKFLRPVLLEDEIVIETTVISIEEKRITLRHTILRNGEITTYANICLALVKDAKSINIPDEIINKFEEYHNGRRCN